VSERTGQIVRGVYRLRFSPNLVDFGTFEVTLNAEGKFQIDTSGSATIEDFEEIAGPDLLDAADDTLDSDYYGRLTGRYTLPDGCKVVVTRSVVRLFIRNSCTQSWRGLVRDNALYWRAGEKVLSDAVSMHIRFAPPGSKSSPSIVLTSGGREVSAQRSDVYRRESVTFSASDGSTFAGTVYIPEDGNALHPAMVMIHGSGPQDRDGYASIMAVMADELAASGRVVLTYDKRGVGGSAGDWSRAGFDVLGGDAGTGIAFLATLPQVDPSRIGFDGSSQAGWVAAAAIAGGVTAHDVFLLGAAGTALTVEEQNLYNTEVLMRCAGIGADDIALALSQQRAFFAFLADPSKATALDDLTRAAATRPALADWLFPDSSSTDRSAGAWYVVLDPRFDPLPVWRGYNGRALFVFNAYDDSTPTTKAIGRLKGMSVESRLLEDSQHLGLRAADVCHAEPGDADSFAPDFFKALDDFAR